MTDRTRAPRDPLVGAKAPLSAGTLLSLLKGALVSAWLSLAERRVLVAHGSGIIMAWGCEPPAPMLGTSMGPASSSRPGGWSHTAAVFFSD